jgi:hypothetical protein
MCDAKSGSDLSRAGYLKPGVVSSIRAELVLRGAERKRELRSDINNFRVHRGKQRAGPLNVTEQVELPVLPELQVGATPARRVSS